MYICNLRCTCIFFFYKGELTWIYYSHLFYFTNAELTLINALTSVIKMNNYSTSAPYVLLSCFMALCGLMEVEVSDTSGPIYKEEITDSPCNGASWELLEKENLLANLISLFCSVHYLLFGIELW